MREIMVNQASTCDLKELVSKFIPESIGKEIEKSTSSIFPLQNVFIRKVKILKAPKFDLGKLMEVTFLFFFLFLVLFLNCLWFNRIMLFCLSFEGSWWLHQGGYRCQGR